MTVLQEIKVPLLSVNDTTLTIAEICFPNGSKVSSGDVILVFESSKTTYDLLAETSGYIEYLCEQGNDYEVNETIARILNDAADVSIRKPIVEAHSEHESTGNETRVWKGDPLFSEAALLLMDQYKMERSFFAGRDFINKNDVESIRGKAKTAIPEIARKDTPQYKQVDLTTLHAEAIKLPGNKKREIEYLNDVQAGGLTSTIFSPMEVEGVLEFINPSLLFFKNSLLPVIIYEASRLLRKYPLLNAFFNENSIAAYNVVNIGFAIDAGKGLKVVKISNADCKTIAATEQEMMDLSTRYLDDVLDVEDLAGITFTVTDLSSQDVLFFKPLVNMNNSAILGVSAIDKKLNRSILSLTFDHRVTDGNTAASFLKELAMRVESYKSKEKIFDAKKITCYKCHKTLYDELGNVGFVQCVTQEGAEAFVCQSCLKGF